METLRAFDFCRHFRSTGDHVDCGRFGKVDSCAPCSICPKCGGRMVLDNGVHNAAELKMIVSGEIQNAKCPLCGFRKSIRPGDVQAAPVSLPPEDEEPKTIPEPEENLDDIELEVEEEPETPAERKTMADKRKTGTCICGCGKAGKIFARGLITSCYFRHRDKKTLEQFPLIAGPGRPLGSATVKGPAPAEEVRKVIETTPTKEEAAVEEKTEKTKKYPSLDVNFIGEDVQLYEELKESARKNRRNLSAEFLFWLEKGFRGQ